METNADLSILRTSQEAPPFDWGSPPRVFSEHTASGSTRSDTGVAMYFAQPIPQRAALSGQNLVALLNAGGGAPPGVYSPQPNDKLERFFEECFHINTRKKIPFGQCQGMWGYYEVFHACETILTKYHFIALEHPKVNAVIKETLSGLSQTLDDLKSRFEGNEQYFKRDFPKLFRGSAVELSTSHPLNSILNDLAEERKKIACVLNEYNHIFLALMKAKKEMEDPQCLCVTFPSLCGSGAIFLTKPFQDDWVALEQFYFDYFEMLNMHELYLHRFCLAIQRGRAILLEGLPL